MHFPIMNKPGSRRKARRIRGSKKANERQQEIKRSIARERNNRKREEGIRQPVGGRHWDLDYV